MLKFGTGKITVPDDQTDGPMTRTAAVYTDEEWQAVMAEGEPDTEE